VKNVFALAAASALMFLVQAPGSASTPPTIRLASVSGQQLAISSASDRCNVAAGIDGTPDFEMPESSSEMDWHGTTQVKIDLNSDGNLADESIYSSSGNYWLDQAAMRSARLTKFTPEVANCQRIAGAYLFEVDF
jgi:TonB family protein